MTRYRLYRLAAISGAVLGIAVLGAGVNALGLHTTLRVVAFCALAGAALSAGWHGIGYLSLRHEEHLQEARRHRAPKPDRGTPRAPSVAEPEQAGVEPEPGQWPAVEGPLGPGFEGAFRDFEQAMEPHLQPPAPRWTPRPAPDPYEDLYARHSPSGT